MQVGEGGRGGGCTGRGLTSGDSFHAAGKVHLPLVVLRHLDQENFDVIFPPLMIASA